MFIFAYSVTGTALSFVGFRHRLDREQLVDAQLPLGEQDLFTTAEPKRIDISPDVWRQSHGVPTQVADQGCIGGKRQVDPRKWPVVGDHGPSLGVRLRREKWAKSQIERRPDNEVPMDLQDHCSRPAREGPLARCRASHQVLRLPIPVR